MFAPPADSPSPAPGAAPWLRRLHASENALMALVLAALVLLPVAEVALRQFFQGGVPAGLPVVQHLVLAVAMLGGALAARENRLVGLSAGNGWLKGPFKVPARIASSGVAAAICALLCGASLQFALESRTLGKVFAFGLRTWVMQLLLVAGFGAISLRLVWHAAPTWRGRGLALLLSAGIGIVAAQTFLDPAALRWPALGAILIALACGAPIFTALGGAALVLFWSAGEPIKSVPLKIYHLTVNPTLPSIPLFTLAGYFLAEGKAAARLVRLFQAVVGDFRGGPALLVTLVCAFFTSFTGASGVTILALGGVLMPVLLTAGYGRRPALGLLTGAGSLGMLFPPCLPPILYSVVASSGGQASVSIAEIFQGGLLPGLLLLGLTAWWGVRQAPPRSPGPRRPVDWREAGAAFRDAIWELLVPVVALGSLFGGFATPVEAAAITALYAFIVNAVIHRDLDWRRAAPRVMAECGLLIGGVLLILGVALAFTHYLVVAEVPGKAVAWVATLESKWLVLLGLNVVLVLVGGLVEIYAAIVVVVPLLVPVGIQLGIDPIHLGIIFLATMELGFIAPPIGLNLLLASYRFDRPVAEVARASLPMLGVLFIGVLLITYFPPLTTFLPRLLR